MDCRRLANRQGLTLYGPKKIFDSRPAGIGMSYADRQGLIRPYLDTAFRRFFQRDLETGDPEVIEALLKQIGADTTEFAAWYEGCLLYTSPSPRDAQLSRMPSSA